LSKEINKQVLKIDFTAHGIMEYLSEFGLCMLDILPGGKGQDVKSR
jgi:hypothetical protein